jgi:hypothetical protein
MLREQRLYILSASRRNSRSDHERGQLRLTLFFFLECSDSVLTKK